MQNEAFDININTKTQRYRELQGLVFVVRRDDQKPLRLGKRNKKYKNFKALAFRKTIKSAKALTKRSKKDV